MIEQVFSTVLKLKCTVIKLSQFKFIGDILIERCIKL